jgi:ribonuclease HI
MENTYKLYTDGSHLIQHDIAGFGGYILDPNNNRICEFSELVKNPEHYNHHELSGLIFGLNKCKEMGIENIECYLDAKAVASMAKSSSTITQKTYVEKLPLAQELFDLKKDFPSIKFNHIYREQNNEADILSHVAIEKLLKERLEAKLAKLSPVGDIVQDAQAQTTIISHLKEQKNPRFTKSLPNMYSKEVLFNKEKNRTEDYFQLLKNHMADFIVFDLEKKGETCFLHISQLKRILMTVL